MVRLVAQESRLRRGHIVLPGQPAVGGALGGDRMLGQNDAAVFAVVVEDFGVAAPIHRGLKLALHLIFGEMLVENVMEKLIDNGVVGFAVKNAVDLLENRDVLQRGLAE